MKTDADWKAPKQDEAHLVWPESSQIISQTRSNASRMCSASPAICNTPLADLRRTARQQIGVGDELLVATGHQIEMYHPGVWVKNILIDSLAKTVGGTAIHFAVDTDTPKHLSLKWPGESHLITDDPAVETGEWSGLVRAPTDTYIRRLAQQFRADAAGWAFKPAIGPFLDQLEHGGEPRLADVLLRGARALDQSLGLDVRFVVATTLTQLDAYLAYVHHVVADIESFASHYNLALADYRREAGISSTTRPMPDLRVTDDEIELPFWYDDLSTGERIRAKAVRADGAILLFAPSGDAFTFTRFAAAPKAVPALREFLEANQLRLSPRALTLTMFFRLFLVDQFVHGIGGARYDQVTDRIIANYFKLDPPDFAVTTATLYFPGAGERTSVCIPCLRSEGHHLRHNLVPAKESYLRAIEQAPRKSIERKSRYLAMHRAIESTVATTDAMPQWKSRLEHAIQRKDDEKVLFDRELFYGIQSAERLTAMIDRYRMAFR